MLAVLYDPNFTGDNESPETHEAVDRAIRGQKVEIDNRADDFSNIHVSSIVDVVPAKLHSDVSIAAAAIAASACRSRPKAARLHRFRRNDLTGSREVS